jgi:hypothetical protein
VTKTSNPCTTKRPNHAIHPHFATLEPLHICYGYLHSVYIMRLSIMSILILSSPQYAPEALPNSRRACPRGGKIPVGVHAGLFHILRPSQIRARERVVRARNCEPELREHLAIRMRRRAAIQKRQADAAGRSFNFARASSPHYTSIQNVSPQFLSDLHSLIFSPIDDLHHRPRSYRGPVLCQQ